jgi:hypothetical protein
VFISWREQVTLDDDDDARFVLTPTRLIGFLVLGY